MIGRALRVIAVIRIGNDIQILNVDVLSEGQSASEKEHSQYMTDESGGHHCGPVG